MERQVVGSAVSRAWLSEQGLLSSREGKKEEECKGDLAFPLPGKSTE